VIDGAVLDGWRRSCIAGNVALLTVITSPKMHVAAFADATIEGHHITSTEVGTEIWDRTEIAFGFGAVALGTILASIGSAVTVTAICARRQLESFLVSIHATVKSFYNLDIFGLL